MPEISFVFDRTLEDLSVAKTLRDKIFEIGYDKLTDAEKELWNTDLKGCRNASDLNRIGNACNIIASMMYTVGLIPEEIHVKDDWTISEIPSVYEIENLLGAIEVLRSVAIRYDNNIDNVPNNPINTIEKMNLVERILYEVYNITNIILTDRQVCGEDYRCYSEAQVSDLDGRLI